jgi:hypothetical protein
MPAAEYHHEVPVAVPVEQAWELLADLSRWSEWNPFVVRVVGARRPVLGAVVELDIRWGDGSRGRAREQVVELVDADGRLGFRWAYRGVWARLGLVRGTRLVAVERVDERSCRYLSGERFEGLFTPLLPMAKIRDGFDRMGAAFAETCAARWPADR